jgi:hypothetical protein
MKISPKTVIVMTAVITSISLVVAISSGRMSAWIATVAFAAATGLQLYNIRRLKARGTTPGS